MTSNLIWASHHRYLPSQERVSNVCVAGSFSDQHVLRAPGLVLHAGAGRAAAQQCHDLHEPAHHRPPPRQQEDWKEENNGNTKPKANV